MKHPRLWLVGLGVVGVALAWRLRFIQDDAFISFCYARNLVEGTGLTWFGTRIEGYTNFLWVSWIALGLRLGVSPIAWAHLGGIASYLTTILCLWRLAYLIFKEHLPGIVAVILFITNYTTVSYATGGLETMLQTALLCAAAGQLYVIRGETTPGSIRPAVFSLILGAAVLTRMDSALPGAILGLIAGGHLYRKRSSRRSYLALVAPFVVIVGCWLAWKMQYYGRLLPHSFYVKVDGQFNPNGFIFLGRFLHWYLIWPFLLFGGVVILLRRDIPRFRLWPLLLLVLSWGAYIVCVGGDFMEFRFLVPVAPFLFILLGYLFCYCPLRLPPRARTVVTVSPVLVLVAASVHHARTFRGMTEDLALDSIPTLATFYGVYPNRDWTTLGAALHDQLGGSDVIIATHATGAIPYYSGLKTVDMWGLNDPGILVHGKRMPRTFRRPGHRIHTTVSYLRERGANLVIGHPAMAQRGMLSDPQAGHLWRGVVDNMVFMNEEEIGEAAVVSMPIDDEYGLVMWYLTPHPRVEQLVRSGAWESTRVTGIIPQERG